jgi:hypothetical protein
MRIGMKYGTPPSSCGAQGYGEVEDYTIYIANGNLAAELSNTLDEEELETELKTESPSIELSIYPNPVANELHVTLPTVNPMDQLILINNNGQQVIQQSAMHNNSLNVSHLPQGIYYLRIPRDNEIISKKIVITR